MEIERKWLMEGLPDIKEEKHIRITQGYISVEPEVRIRSYQVLSGKDMGHIDHLLTIKGNGGLSREEVETYITEGQFNSLAALIGRPLIEKDYWKYLLDGHVLEVSVVDPGTKDAFCYGEIEFLSEEEAMAYEFPLKGKDVTEDQSYKMKNYWVRTRIEALKKAEERYKEFTDARATLCAYCGGCFFPKITNMKCSVAQLGERLHDKAVEDGIIKE